MKMDGISADDLFGKWTEGNLSKKSLKGASKKERLDIVESNLEFLLDFYFGKGQKDHKGLDHVYELVGSEKYFLEPLLKLIKKDKKGKNIPKGLHIIFQDAAFAYRRIHQQNVQRMQNMVNGQNSELGSEMSKKQKNAFEDLCEEFDKVASLLVRADAKKFQKEGIQEPYATMLAKALVPARYLTRWNIGRYFSILNNTLIDIARLGIVRDDSTEDGEVTYQNRIGIRLLDKVAILAIYNIFFKGVDRETFLTALLRFLLERRGKVIKSYNKPQREMFNNINAVVADILEGTEVVKLSKDKLKKKELKKQAVSKKELKHIMKKYAEIRIKDLKKNNDSPRRILIHSLSEEEYPRLVKAFEKIVDDGVNDVNEEDHSEEDKDGNNNHQNHKPQQKNNPKNDSGDKRPARRSNNKK